MVEEWLIIDDWAMMALRSGDWGELMVDLLVREWLVMVKFIVNDGNFG